MLFELIYKRDIIHSLKLYKLYSIVKYINTNYIDNSKD